ncbi:MAG: pyrroline-5-carboxylate reductase [Proteobacteria bacterium]|nr:pyrroline-5-carboxylate reductase [Pseudomonadota bacterium]
MKKPTIIGCGNMGGAIVDALLQQGIYSAEELTIIEKFRNPLIEKFAEQSATILNRVDDYAGNFELAILAVKPQDSLSVVKDLSAKVNQETLVISIMAGISLPALENELKGAQIVRCMPNTPASIHMGMSVYCGNKAVTQESFRISNKILSAMGKAFQVNDEKMIDAATAISGSGPAYVFYLAEALKEGALELGFDDSQADTLATQTLLGAATLLNKTDDSPEELRRKVTSPGGTTEAALRYYKENGLKKILMGGFQAAYERSLQLGKS